MISKVILAVDGPAYFRELTPQWISLESGAALPVSALDYKAGKPTHGKVAPSQSNATFGARDPSMMR